MNGFGDVPYLQTHPSDQDRINAFIIFSDKLPDRGQSSSEWQEEFEIIRALLFQTLIYLEKLSAHTTEKNRLLQNLLFMQKK